MSRVAVALIALLLGASLAQSVGPSANALANLQHAEQLLAGMNYEALSDEERAAYDIFSAYIKSRYEEINNPEPKSVSRRAPIPGLYPGIYNKVDLLNAEDFKVRQVSAINLHSLITDFLSSACGVLAIVCKPIIDDVVELILDNFVPDMTFIQSLNLAAAVDKSLVATADMDLLMHLVSFPPKKTTTQNLLDQYFKLKLLPSASVAYFSGNAQFSGNFLATALSLDASAFAISQSFMSLIEFVDKNGNNEYDKGEEVSEMELHKIGWVTDPLTKIEEGATVVYELLSSTTDNVMNMFCVTASLPVVAGDGQVITPHSLKCSIVIVNYPYKAQNSHLAMKTFVALAEGTFGGEATTKTQGVLLNSQSPSSKNGFINWVDTVTTSADPSTNTRSFNVVASGTASKRAGVVDFIGELAIAAGGSGSADAREIIYTFQTDPNAGLIIWDPSVGYGRQGILPPTSQNAAASLTPVAAMLAAVALAVAALL